MSIFNKVLILFLISFSLMIFVSTETNKLTQSTIENLLKDKYIQVSSELFKYLSNSNIKDLEKKATELRFKIIKNKGHYFDTSKSIYEYKTTLSTIRILKNRDNKYLLYMKYIDDDILMIDLSQEKTFFQKGFLDYLILADILILVILFLIILKMIYPLKEISKSIKIFGDGDYKARVKNISHDEIGEVATTFNSMASNIEELISSRKILLRDIAHELKTPISKSKLAVEMIKESKYQKILKKALLEMDNMTNELLYIEKLNANQYILKLKKFNIETLISEALSKLYIEDESLIEISIELNFSLNADLNYLSIALKNLIDNALKYSIDNPIFIIVKDKKIFIKSKGDKLTKPLEFYCESFTQGDNSRNQKGYGLGLSLVTRILDRHNFKLSYSYYDGFNIFIINI